MGQQIVVADPRAQGRSPESVGADVRDAANRLRSRPRAPAGGIEIRGLHHPRARPVASAR